MRQRTVNEIDEQMSSNTAVGGQWRQVIARLDMRRLTHELTLRHRLVCHAHHHSSTGKQFGIYADIQQQVTFAHMKSHNHSETTTSSGSQHAEEKGPILKLSLPAATLDREQKRRWTEVSYTFSWSLSSDNHVHRKVHFALLSELFCKREASTRSVTINLFNRTAEKQYRWPWTAV